MDVRGGDLTDGGCSGNVLPRRRGSSSAPEESEAEAEREEDDEPSEAEVRQDGWREEEQRVANALHVFLEGPPTAVAHTYWKERGEETIWEARVVRMGGKNKKLMVYFPHGEGKTATTAEWQRASTRARVARQREKGSTITFPWPQERAIQHAIRGELLRSARPLSLLKWGRLFKLFHPDSRQHMWAEYACCRCGYVRRVDATATEAIMGAAQRKETTCAVVGLGCGQPSTARILPWAPHNRLWDKEDEAAYCSPRHEDQWSEGKKGSSPKAGDKGKRQEGCGSEEEGEQAIQIEEDDDGEGFSAGALRFYRSNGKAIPLPEYGGSPSESAFLSWKRRVERHFVTYGIRKEKEKVMIAADLLVGDALGWWEGIWTAGRETEITTWEELRRRLRIRFLPPEGEMRTVGQWRRLSQTGTVAAYSDYVYRLQAMCSMRQNADFKLAFYGLRPELQGEIRKFMRQRELKTLSLEKMFEVASDAELALGRLKGDGSRREEASHGQRKEEGGKTRGEGREGFKGPRVNQLDGAGVLSPATTAGASSTSSRWGKPPARGTGKEGSGERGSEPCAVCDEWGHGWPTCSKRKAGRGCARCGSTAHRVANCPRRRRLPKEPVAPDKEEDGPDPWGTGPQVYNLGVTLPCEVAGFPRTRLLQYEVKAGGKKIRAMLDSGATVNAVSAGIVELVGGVVKPSTEEVRMADGRPVKADGTTSIKLTGKGYAETIPCLVIRGLTADLLLGRPWLEMWNPTVDWLTGRLTFSDGVTWTPTPEARELVLTQKRWTFSEKDRQRTYGALIQSIPEASAPISPEDDPLPPCLKGFDDIFEEPGQQEEGEPAVVHRLRLDGAVEPIRKAPYRMAPKQREALETELKAFLKKGWIRPSQSPWATVALVVPKKDRTWRVCIDYRDLNAVTRMDAYPLPKIDELLNRLARAQIFSKVDLHSGFHQIPMEESSIPLTGFRVSEPIEGCSHFEWRVMPMGLSTAPPTFQRWMELSLQGLEAFTLVYLDDVLIYSENEETHQDHLQQVFRRFRERGMKLKRRKCLFAEESIPFLGHLVSKGQIRVDEDKLGRLSEWKPPLRNVKEVRQFLGFLSYYRAFVSHFAELTAPLTLLLKKAKKWEWTTEATRAVEEGKQVLLEARARYAWDPERADRVSTDASDVGLGAAFEQRIPGLGWAPIAFWSRKLSAAEVNYSVTDKEWLAVVEAVTRHWRHWLLGRRFTLRTDHAALRQLLRTKGEQFTARQARWAERLGEFAFDFEYIPGPSNAAADALSRSPVECISALEIQQCPPKSLSPSELEEAAAQDEDYQADVKRSREANWWGWCVDEQGLLRDSRHRVRVPKSETLRYKLILEAHEPPFCGHLGVKRTWERLRSQWSWDGMRENVEELVRACDVCQKDSIKEQRDKAPLNTIVAARPWEVVTLDFLSGLTPAVPGKWEGCVVVCDRFTRMMHVKECPTHPTAEEAARLFIELVVSRHGVPVKIITDRGTQFESVLWEEVVTQLGSRVAMATTHHPQTNGLTERANRTLLQMIRRVCVGQGHKWVKWLPLMEMAYNSSVHSITRLSPFMANYGYHPKLPAAFLCSPQQRSDSSPPPSVTTFCQQLQEAAAIMWEQIKKESEAAGHQAERREARRRGNPKYQAGDEVLCYQFHLGRGEHDGSRKQQLRYAGPFRVARANSHGWVELDGLPPQAPTKINCEYVKPYRRHLLSESFRNLPPPPPAALDEQGARWEVEAILDVRTRRTGREYRIKWQGYDRPTWEPERNLDGCEVLKREFHRRRRPAYAPTERRRATASTGEGV